MSRPDASREKSLNGPPAHVASDVDHLVELDRRHVWHPFARPGRAPDEVLVASGCGAILRTADGREIFDGISSWWVNLFGHGHPVIAQAIARQARQLEQVLFAGFTHEPAIRLAHALAGLLPGDLNRVFFSDDGSTSVEVALKIAWQFWQISGKPERNRIMVFQGGYHGDTLGAMSAGVTSGFFDAWRNQMVAVDAMPFPSTWDGDDDVETKESAALNELDRYLEVHADRVAAMILEPLVQGAAGMRMTRPAFVHQVIDRLRSHSILVILDEVMTGFGRTGRNFACQHSGVVPDMICLSKGITGGFLPLGVTAVCDRVCEAFHDESSPATFNHGHSYTANPLACAAALATLELLRQPETRAAWSRINAAHRRGLGMLAALENATKPRSVGTIAAIEVASIDAPYGSLASRRLADWFRRESNLLVRPLGNVIYLMPPYCATDQQLDAAWQAIATGIAKFENG